MEYAYNMQKKLLLILISVFSVFLLNQCKGGTEGVIVHIKSGPETAEGKHRIVMALNIANMALKKDRNVLVFFDVKGVSVPLKNSPDITHESHKDGFQSAKAGIRAVLDNGGRVMVCPTCLEAGGYSKEDMMEGVEEGNFDSFFNFTDGRIVTLDW